MTDYPAPSRRQMARRLQQYSVLEIVNVGVIGGVLFWSLGVPPSVANMVGYTMVAVLLVEGAAYWSVKHRQLRSGSRRPSGMGVFRQLRWVNVLLLALALVAIVPSLWREPGVRSWPGLGLWLFAVAEHVNYLHLQLSHQTKADLRRLSRNCRLRRSHLAADLARHAEVRAWRP